MYTDKHINVPLILILGHLHPFHVYSFSVIAGSGRQHSEQRPHSDSLKTQKFYQLFDCLVVSKYT